MLLVFSQRAPESSSTRGEVHLQAVFVWIGDCEACRAKRRLTDPFRPVSILIPITVCTPSRVHGFPVMSVASWWLREEMTVRQIKRAGRDGCPYSSSFPNANCLLILHFEVFRRQENEFWQSGENCPENAIFLPSLKLKEMSLISRLGCKLSKFKLAVSCTVHYRIHHHHVLPNQNLTGILHY